MINFKGDLIEMSKNKLDIEDINSYDFNVPAMTKGSQPTDGGNLIIEVEDYDDFIRRELAAKNMFALLSARNACTGCGAL